MTDAAPRQRGTRRRAEILGLRALGRGLALLVAMVFCVGSAIAEEICGNGRDDDTSGATYGACPAGWQNAFWTGVGCDRKCPPLPDGCFDDDNDGYPTCGTAAFYNSGTATVNGTQATVSTIVLDTGHTLTPGKKVRIPLTGGGTADRNVLSAAYNNAVIDSTAVSVDDNAVITVVPQYDCDDNNGKIFPGEYATCGTDGTKLCNADGTFASCSEGELCEATGSGDCFYIDPSGGSNASNGQSRATAWADQRMFGYFGSGSDSPPSGKRTPVAGDVYYLMGGTHSTGYYAGSPSANWLTLRAFDCTRTNRCVVKAYPGESPVVQDPNTASAGIGILTYQSDWWKFSGFKIDGQGTVGDGSGLSLSEATSDTMLEASLLEVTGRAGNKDNLAGIVTGNETGKTYYLHHNFIHDNTGTIEAGGGQAAAILWWRGNNFVHHNVVFDQFGHGLKEKHSDYTSLNSVIGNSLLNVGDICGSNYRAIAIAGPNVDLRFNRCVDCTETHFGDQGGESHQHDIIVANNTFKAGICNTLGLDVQKQYNISGTSAADACSGDGSISNIQLSKNLINTSSSRILSASEYGPDSLYTATLAALTMAGNVSDSSADQSCIYCSNNGDTSCSGRGNSGATHDLAGMQGLGLETGTRYGTIGYNLYQQSTNPADCAAGWRPTCNTTLNSIPDEPGTGAPAVAKVDGACPAGYSESKVNTSYCWKLFTTSDRDLDGYVVDDCDNTDPLIYAGIYRGCDPAGAETDGYQVCQTGGTWGSCVANAVTPLCEATGSGQCYYINTSTGNNSNPGTWSSPWLNAACFVHYETVGARPACWVDLDPGDVVYFANSTTYSTMFNSGFGVNYLIWTDQEQEGTSTDRVQIKAYPGREVILSPTLTPPTENFAVYNTGDSMTIDGFIIEGGYGSAIACGYGGLGDDVEISRNVIRNTFGDGDNNLAGIYGGTAGACHIHHNIIWDVCQAGGIVNGAITSASTAAVDDVAAHGAIQKVAVGQTIDFINGSNGVSYGQRTISAVSGTPVNSITWTGGALTLPDNAMFRVGNYQNVHPINLFKGDPSKGDTVEYNKVGYTRGFSELATHWCTGGGIRTKHAATRAQTTGTATWRYNVSTNSNNYGLGPSSAKMTLSDNLVYNASQSISLWPGGPTYDSETLIEYNLMKGRAPFGVAPDDYASATVNTEIGPITVRKNIGVGTLSALPGDGATVSMMQYCHNNWFDWFVNQQGPYSTPGDTYYHLAPAGSASNGFVFNMNENNWAEIGGATLRIDLCGDGAGSGSDYNWTTWRALTGNAYPSGTTAARFEQNGVNEDPMLDFNNQPTSTNVGGTGWGPRLTAALMDSVTTTTTTTSTTTTTTSTTTTTTQVAQNFGSLIPRYQ